jgi:hypothetical protein
MAPGNLNDRLILKLIREPVEPREVESWPQSRFMDSDPERIPVRARRGQRSPEGIVDDLLHRASLAMHSILEEPGHVRIEGQGGTHTDIIVSDIVVIKMSY